MGLVMFVTPRLCRQSSSCASEPCQSFRNQLWVSHGGTMGHIRQLPLFAPPAASHSAGSRTIFLQAREELELRLHLLRRRGELVVHFASCGECWVAAILFCPVLTPLHVMLLQ